MNELQQALGAEIRNQRQIVRDMTQQEFSECSGVSRASIASIERGRQSITVNTLYKLSRALSVDAGILLNNAVRRAFSDGKTVSLSDVDNKPDVLNTLNKYV